LGWKFGRGEFDTDGEAGMGLSYDPPSLQRGFLLI
jgi:hypothetical protein